MTIQEFYTEVGGDYNAAKRTLMADKMILRFLPKLGEDPSCGKLEQAWEKKDRRKMFEALHALKGVCANLGLTSLAEEASGALEPLRPGSSLTISDEELGERIGRIRSRYDMTVAKIASLE